MGERLVQGSRRPFKHLALDPWFTDNQGVLSMDMPPADELQEDFGLYFEPLAGTVILPITLLVASKAPETQPGSVSKAAALMRAAADGTVPRRRPISVRPLPRGKYLIVDGNATYGAAIRAGWSSIPANVEAQL